ncbi:sugar ABC transporter ATP-binding protein [Rhizobium sp. 18065]|uniref:sugar ABC transporter ATP-binding protein n=1 Tax=Rhizobium sp. 18065 TaxID=2681411 RepID=UPI001357FE26|nr:sugar ABC transporter ATP-binding protein [Rhizobium sp. 18065]
MSIENTTVRETILSLRNITKTYPGVVALQDVSVNFHAGEVHALLGENGAGKSTLIKSIAGAVTPDSGEIVYGDKSFTAVSPALSRILGVEVIYQEFNLVPTLSVAENVFLGSHRGWRTNYAAMRTKATALFNELNVAIDPDTLVRDLSSSQQQLVEIAKALAKKPKILVMDEPSAPLSLAEVENLFRVVRKVRDAGTCVLYISHRMDEIFALSDRVSVLRDGRHIATVETGSTDRDALIRMMVGRTLSETYPQRQPPTDIPALELDHLSGNGDRDVSVTLHKGEILGVAGLIGAGRTELAKLIMGAENRESGEIRLHGKPVHFSSPKEAIAAGIGLVPENRKEEGCFLNQPVRWNISIGALKWLKGRLGIDKFRETSLAEEYRSKLRIKTPSIEQRVGALSGGNQQKVVIAKILASRTDVMIFDEPTRGIDVGARGEIYRLMTDLAAEGYAILMITSDMDELLGMSDRVLVLHEGGVTGILPRAECTQERIMELASGLTDGIAA